MRFLKIPFLIALKCQVTGNKLKDSEEDIKLWGKEGQEKRKAQYNELEDLYYKDISSQIYYRFNEILITFYFFGGIWHW